VDDRTRLARRREVMDVVALSLLDEFTRAPEPFLEGYVVDVGAGGRGRAQPSEEAGDLVTEPVDVGSGGVGPTQAVDALLERRQRRPYLEDGVLQPRHRRGEIVRVVREDAGPIGHAPGVGRGLADAVANAGERRVDLGRERGRLRVELALGDPARLDVPPDELSHRLLAEPLGAPDRTRSAQGR